VATIPEQLADLAADLTRRGATYEILRMRLYTLDTLAVTLSGTVSPSSEPMRRTVLAAAGKPEATIFGTGPPTCSTNVVLAIEQTL